MRGRCRPQARVPALMAVSTVMFSLEMKRTCVAGLNCSSIDRFRGWLFALLQVLILEPHGHPDDKFCFCS